MRILTLTLALAGSMSMSACGGKPTTPAGPAAPTSPTSFAGASRTWEVNNQSVDNCSVVDVQVCPDGGDIESCATEHLRPYDCPPEGIWGSSPWHVYLLGDTCWLHGEPMPGCEPEVGGDDCKPPVTRRVDCPE